ncbi:MAG: hypothetical protein COC22_01900 [Flavobacteriaceae bacterium]|nr:MAG: hypothetical protein COC22_01900 [Flavobacteriaceae bacterium]
MVLFASCKSTQNLNFTLNEIIFTKIVNCPENGDCTVELIPNKFLEFKKDDIGALYPVITEGEKTILKYTYKKKPALNTQDSNYTEIVYAELNKTITEISLSSKELQTIKLYFGRLCYCKGETGYYPIKNGNFEIEKAGKNTVKIEFDFNIKEVPQIISKISETISLKSNETN